MLDSSRFLECSPMYDLRNLRDNLDGLRAQLGPRGTDIPWDDLRKLIEDRRNLTMKLEQERHEIRKVA
jgi:seryl-tRNA synthetase